MKYDQLKTCRIKIEGGKLEVKFTGVWRRSDIETAYRGMLLELPRHLYLNLRGEQKEVENERA